MTAAISGMWLVLLMVIGQQGPATPAAIHRRLSVRRSGDGYAVIGFRAAVGAERFRVTAGMSAAELLRQIRSVRWDQITNQLDAPRAALMVRRSRRGGASEYIAVAMTEPGPRGRARLVTYAVEPARFSRFGLVRFLRSAFGRGRALIDRPDRLTMLYRSPKSPVRLRVEATRLPRAKSKWRLVYLIEDPRLLRRPVSTRPTTAPGRPGAARPIVVWPTTAAVDQNNPAAP